MESPGKGAVRVGAVPRLVLPAFLSKKPDDEEEEEDEKKDEAVTKQLTKIFRERAADLRRLVNRANPQPADDFADAGADDAQAVDQAAPDKPAEGNNQ